MIETLFMPASTVGENPIRFPIPQTSDWGTVTVLCGPNGCGKSYILRTLKDLLSGKKSSGFAFSQGWRIGIRDLASPTSHRPKHHKSQMNSIGILSAAGAAKTPAHNDDELITKIALFGLVLSSFEGGAAFENSKWISDSAYRVKIFGEITKKSGIAKNG
jgi:ABC-type cobalamin transport system ATPase subunit